MPPPAANVVWRTGTASGFEEEEGLTPGCGVAFKTPVAWENYEAALSEALWQWRIRPEDVGKEETSEVEGLHKEAFFEYNPTQVIPNFDPGIADKHNHVGETIATENPFESASALLPRTLKYHFHGYFAWLSQNNITGANPTAEKTWGKTFRATIRLRQGGRKPGEGTVLAEDTGTGVASTERYFGFEHEEHECIAPTVFKLEIDIEVPIGLGTLEQEELWLEVEGESRLLEEEQYKERATLLIYGGKDPSGRQGEFHVTSVPPTGPNVWSATGLPKGLTINPSTGEISGTPTTVEEPTVKLTLTTGENSASTEFKWRIDEPKEFPCRPGGIRATWERETEKPFVESGFSKLAWAENTGKIHSEHFGWIAEEGEGHGTSGIFWTTSYVAPAVSVAIDYEDIASFLALWACTTGEGERNGYRLVIQEPLLIKLEKWVAGAPTTLAEFTMPEPPVNENDGEGKIVAPVFGLSVKGGKVKGVLGEYELSASDTTFKEGVNGIEGDGEGGAYGSVKFAACSQGEEEVCVKPSDVGAPWEPYTPILKVEPGDHVLSASSGRVLMNVEGKLYEIARLNPATGKLEFPLK